MNEKKKFQKKVLQLINAIKKCDIDDLTLFVGLCLIRFENLDHKNGDSDSTIFSQCVYIQTSLSKDDNIVGLLK